ncbi:unnamed protein product [Porites lobata]|uniref:G-protein coupled receptors family 1 profile domain-containing protein n=1 Tax=Porites lobata TaxID=104759 RepID=A0ABN8R7S5_9CNID|nr:unnamed protein product [Porites lobata]
MSLLDKYPCDNTTAPTYLSFSTACCSALIAFIATVGNFLVILAVILNPCKDLRSPFNYFVANLSFADLAVGLIVAPLSVAHHVMEGVSLRNQYLEDTLHVGFFYLLHRFTPEPGSLGSRSVRGHYIPPVLQNQAQFGSNILSVSCCLALLHFIISLLLCSRLQQVSFHLREYCRRCDIFCNTFYQLKNFQFPPRTSKGMGQPA